MAASGYQWGFDEPTRISLADPGISLPAYGKVIDQATGDAVLFNPEAITVDLQNTIISYVSETPRNEEGYTRWLCLLKYRQAGASTTAAMALYPKASYNIGWNHITIADNKDRADGLHERVMFTHNEWDESIRTPQITTTESRNLSLANYSRMRVLSGHSGAVGIGRSVSSLLASELPYWADAAGQFSLIGPSMYNRLHALMIKESTPAPLAEPSGTWWRDTCYDAKRGRGRDIYAFFPYWDGKLNVRKWPAGSAPDLEEIRLLEKYGERGLQLKHLAFRRFVMESDADIRRNHDLFGVYYPFDDSSCWISSGNSVIPAHVMARHRDTHRPESGDYVEYEPPKAGSIYVIGCDPAGYGGRDHAAFQVLELWQDEWRQVASFGAVIDPSSFERLVFNTGIRYNTAMVAVERNGVGVACIELLKRDGYPRVFHDLKFKGGIHKGSHDEFMSILVDKLLDKLYIQGQDTYDQLCAYSSDKAIERSVKTEISNPNAPLGRRRPRHHFDKVSALMIACCAGERMGVRHKAKLVEPTDAEVVEFAAMTFNQIEKYAAKLNRPSATSSGGRTTYTRTRR